MQHFAKDDGMNIFRLPVGWQYLVNGKLGGTLDASNFGRYQSLVQACLGTGAYCMLDVRFIYCYFCYYLISFFLFRYFFNFPLLLSTSFFYCFHYFPFSSVIFHFSCSRSP